MFKHRLAKHLILSAFLFSGWLRAQTSGGVFRGTVQDSSGAIVSQVKISIRSVEKGTELATASNGEGVYTTPDLIPGSYTLRASREGFKTEIFGPVAVDVNQIVRVDFKLSPGEVSDSVRVEATATQLLSTEDAVLTQIVSSKQVSEIPLNGRAWQQLIGLSAGVNPGAPGESGSPNPVNVNGQRTKGNLFLVDGIPTTSDAQGRGNNFNMPLEAIQEFSIQSGSYPAEFGNAAGGVINLQSKSGGNQWNGSAFEFFRNDAMDAANFFSNATKQAKNPLRYNQFGGALGGPIQRDRTFFFLDYQGTLARSGSPMLTTLPSASQRQGDFSDLRDAQGAIVPIYDPFSASAARPQFSGNRIPVARMDPAAIKLTSLLPQPNQFDASGRPLLINNYAVTRTVGSNVQSFDVRVDRQLSTKSTLFIRESFQKTSSVTPSLFGPPLGGPPTGAGTTDASNQNAGAGHIYQFNSRWINELRLGLNRQTTALKQEDFGQNLSDMFGIPGVNQSQATSGLSTLAISGLFSLGGSVLTPLKLATTDGILSDKVTWVRGRHTIHFGAEAQRGIGSAGYLAYGRGYYTFLNLTTSTATGPPGGNAFASFLVGAPFQVLRDTFLPGLIGLVSARAGFYVQDDFKVTSRLTLNLGGRYDIMPYPYERYNRLSNFDPATRTMLLAGRDTSSRLANTDDRNLAPRIGLAYSPGRFGKTVLRAGYGIGFVDPAGAAGILNGNEFNIPFYYLNNITQFPFSAPAYTRGIL